MRSFPRFITKFLNLLTRCNSPSHLLQIQAQLILHNLHSNTTIARHFISASQSLGLLDSALRLFDRLPKPHVFICNSLIRAFSHVHSPHTPFFIYARMLNSSIRPNNFTFPFLLKSLADFNGLREGQCVHAHVVKLGQYDDIYVQNALLNLYASCGDMGLCLRLFDEIPHRDVVSWTVLIAGYRGAKRCRDALLAFQRMQYDGVVPNHVTMVNALSACADFGALDMGVWIHEFIRARGWELDVILGTSLIDMYGRCGRIEEGLAVFKGMKEKNVYTWNSLIKGLALAKSGEEAVWWFYRLGQQGIKPDEITLIAVLCACSHSGMVQTGKQIFGSLVNREYGFEPGIKHYACMVDLLARAGILREAMEVMAGMPFQPTKAMWGSFLAGCRAHGDLELSEFAARKLMELEPGNGAYYAILSNIYAEMGRWNEVERVRRLMKEGGLAKDLGYSSIELEPQENVYELLAGFHRGPQIVSASIPPSIAKPDRRLRKWGLHRAD